MTNAIFVTGATGTVGRGVVNALITKGEKVIAGVRDAKDAELLPDGVEGRPFHFGASTGELEDVLEGTDRLFLMRPPQIADVQTQLFPLIDAARNRRTRQTVFLSMQGVQLNKLTPHHAVEEYMRQIDAPYTFLRPNFFMQNLSTTYAAEIRERGVIYVPAGRSFTAFIDARDIGRVAATTFTEPGHTRKAYTLSGEQSLSYRHIARTMTEALGRPITYARPSEKDYLAHLAAEGQPQDYIDVQKMIYRIVRFNLSALPNRTVRQLTGVPATTFAEFVHNNQSAWTPQS
ncbi:NAD(P)H-binding protein (plasmid) [Glaciihabitans sp. INWT7]|uniref:NmrA family NAD(P)-binding protein n=1 Tax=Glaciihabitans sp. INWT7 TaxID=2596912 RepID=UPI0016241205|nr:NmrA family NAD(P)-binding protein [Glaciihabitans sp. INWT7]QNE48623.1 NAD(P)H-binding protein [Glaciihabitans sp. INWT7]